jgi:uncharacterized protein (TIGR03437 family)
MPRAVRLLVAALAAMSGLGADRGAPSYSAATIVNSASNELGFFAPNTFLTIYGSNLSFTSRSMADTDIRGNSLPNILPGTGVMVLVNKIPAQVYYVSPTQINILIPSDAIMGTALVEVTRDGTAGPAVTLTLQRASPALFQSDPQTAIGLHLDGTLLTPASPGRPGEIVTLFATGLGTTVPRTPYGEIPRTAAPIIDIASFSVLLDGSAIGRERILYAGVAPGFGGLYQINLRLPDQFARAPEVRLQMGQVLSKAEVRLPLEP